jgi:hypothetical protein
MCLDVGHGHVKPQRGTSLAIEDEPHKERREEMLLLSVAPLFVVAGFVGCISLWRENPHCPTIITT